MLGLRASFGFKWESDERLRAAPLSQLARADRPPTDVQSAFPLREMMTWSELPCLRGELLWLGFVIVAAEEFCRRF